VTVAEANKLRRLLHAKKYGYKIHVTTWANAHFGHVEKVTLKKVTFKEEDEADVRIDKIETINLFVGNVSLDDLDE